MIRKRVAYFIFVFLFVFLMLNTSKVYALEDKYFDKLVIDENCNFINLDNKKGISTIIESELVKSKGLKVCNTFKSISNTKKKNIGTIFVGDSRFVGMNDACDMDFPVVAKVSKGYKWFKSDGLKKINEIKNDSNKDSWRIVINLGVNDLYNVNKYIDLYKDLSKDYEVVLVSVNPTEKNASVSNKSISNFNSKISKINGIKYIDSYNYLMNDGYSTTDGVHYTYKTYKKIYNYILESI